MEKELCGSQEHCSPPITACWGHVGPDGSWNLGLAVCAAPTSHPHSCRRAWTVSSRSW